MGKINGRDKNMTLITILEYGGEMDYCLNCGGNGDDVNIKKIINTNKNVNKTKFICTGCETKLKESYEFIKTIKTLMEE